MRSFQRRILTRRKLAVSIAALLLYAFAGFVIAPVLIRWYVPNYVRQSLHCRARLDKVRINPFFLTMEIDGFSLTRTDGRPLVAFHRLMLDLETSSLFHSAIVLRELDIDRPDIHMDIEPGGVINLQRLASMSARPSRSATTDGRPLPILIQHTVIRQGRITVVDGRHSRPASFTFGNLDLHLQDLSTIKGHSGTYALSATTDEGGTIRGRGTVLLAPFRSDGELTFKAIRVAGLWKLFRDKINLAQPAGLIDLDTKYHLDIGRSPVQMTLGQLRLVASGLSLKLPDADKASLEVGRVDIEANHCDLGTHTIMVSRVSLNKGHLEAYRDDKGRLDWLQLFHTEAAGTTHAAGPAAAWKYLIAAVDVDGFGARFSDLTTHSDKPVVSLSHIHARLTGIDGKTPVVFSLGFQMGQGGK